MALRKVSLPTIVTLASCREGEREEVRATRTVVSEKEKNSQVG